MYIFLAEMKLFFGILCFHLAKSATFILVKNWREELEEEGKEKRGKVEQLSSKEERVSQEYYGSPPFIQSDIFFSLFLL